MTTATALRIAAFAGLAALGLVDGCYVPTADPCEEQGIPRACTLTGGSASATYAEAGASLVANGCMVAAAPAPNYGQDASELTLTFAFGGGMDAGEGGPASAALTCSVSRASLTGTTAPIPLASACVATLAFRGPILDPQLYGACCGNATAPVTVGTLTPMSKLDADGNGQLAVQLDIPPTDLVGFDIDTQSMHAIHIEAHGLVTSTTFATEASPAPDCNAGL